MGTRTIAGYLDALASAEPTPGGGSAVAVVVSLGAALGEMVCRLTIDHPDYAGVAAELRRCLTRLGGLREEMLALAAADEAAYGRYIAAADLPRATAEEKIARRAELQRALWGAADVPLAVMAGCAALAVTLEPVARLGNRHLVSDAMVAARLAEAGLLGAAESVRANTRLIRDDDERAPREERLETLLADGAIAARRVREAAETRL